MRTRIRRGGRMRRGRRLQSSRRSDCNQGVVNSCEPHQNYPCAKTMRNTRVEQASKHIIRTGHAQHSKRASKQASKRLMCNTRAQHGDCGPGGGHVEPILLDKVRHRKRSHRSASCTRQDVHSAARTPAPCGDGEPENTPQPGPGGEKTSEEDAGSGERGRLREALDRGGKVGA